MIATWSEGSADDNMAESILLELSDIVRKHPWWRARAVLTLELLAKLDVQPPARVCDVGCGWGVTLGALEDRGYRVVGMDISRSMLERLDRPERKLVVADLTKPLPEDVEPFDAVLVLDVLEHLDDDRSATERLGRLVQPRGVVVVSVPALPDFYTEFDEIQGHRLRYTPETLSEAFIGSGLEIERLFFWGAWLVPALRRQRRRCLRRYPGESAALIYKRYLRLPPWPVPLFLRAMFALERDRAIAGKLATGTSLFAIARRRDDRD